MNRSRLLSFFVVAVLVAFSACSWVSPSGPGTPANPYTDLIGTTVAETSDSFPVRHSPTQPATQPHRNLYGDIRFTTPGGARIHFLVLR